MIKKIITILSAAAMLAGCALPGEQKNEREDDYFLNTTAAPVSAPEQTAVNYRWAMRPTLSCDNIITPDGSLFDPDRIASKAYMYASIITIDGKYGFIDFNGQMIVYPEYESYKILPSGEIGQVVARRSAAILVGPRDAPLVRHASPPGTASGPGQHFLHGQSGRKNEGMAGHRMGMRGHQ